MTKKTASFKIVNDLIDKEVKNEKKRVNTCYVFGVHKGGSTMLANFFQISTKSSDLKAVSIPNHLFRAGIGDGLWLNDDSLQRLVTESLVYYGFRDVPNWMIANKSAYSKYRSISLVRNPLDCVVSAYYSFRKSHVVSANLDSDSAKQVHKERELYKDIGIDEYCLNESHRFFAELYKVALFSNVNNKIYRYEDIIFSKRKFFTDCISHLNFEISKRSFEQALKRVDIIPDKENKNSHIRSVKPGNHVEKLKKETIYILTNEYSYILKLFSYL